jgi:hypothetical protein
MNEQIDPAAKAEAARAREEEARKKAQKNTIVFGFAMFGVVFALLSFKYVTGSDPSLRTDSLSAQREAAPAQQDQWQGDDDGGGDDDWQQQAAPQDQGQSAPPTTGAS